MRNTGKNQLRTLLRAASPQEHCTTTACEECKHNASKDEASQGQAQYAENASRMPANMKQAKAKPKAQTLGRKGLGRREWMVVRGRP